MCVCVYVRVCSLALLLSTHNGNLINIHKHTHTHSRTQARAQRELVAPVASCVTLGGGASQLTKRLTVYGFGRCNRYFN